MEEGGQIAAAEALVNVLNDALIVINHAGHIEFANNAAEHFFLLSQTSLKTKKLSEIIAQGSPLLSLVDSALKHRSGFAEYDMDISLHNGVTQKADVKLGVVDDKPLSLFLQIETKTIADKISRQLMHRNAARSVTGAAALLAHEIKNPLAGIKGAAQLLHDGLNAEEKTLTDLITQEVDRIDHLVSTMEDFSDPRPLQKSAQNIHEILDHALKVVSQGASKTLSIKTLYDPSLPPISGHRDKLIQVFINLIKNAVEAVENDGGTLTVSTAYSHGMRMNIPGSAQPVTLPIEVIISDNGPGISDDILSQIFEPFVTTKTNGKGLGLALVAKLIAEHGGVIDCETQPGKTAFHILLPKADQAETND